MDTYFDIPVVLFFFKREEKTVRIIERISMVKPKKIYLIADGPRNAEEKKRVDRCREMVEKSINWDCEVVKNYSEINQGVYNRIGMGSKWVLEQEENAIFLEDDNLPEISFFRFCKEMLEMYKEDNRVLWICGTNYLEKHQPSDGSSYVFTKHMLPCGWASWSSKFPKYYDGEMELWKESYIKDNIRREIDYKPLAKQLIRNWESVVYQFKTNGKPVSWDHQMSFTQRSQNLFAIVPKYNLIENIGVDQDSEHGGTSMKNKMTKRFCGMKSIALEFPLTHPKGFLTDSVFERKISKIVTYPIDYRLKSSIINIIKSILGKDLNQPFRNK